MVEGCSEILPYQKKPKMESFLEPTNSLNSKRFNQVISSARQVVERSYELLKGRLRRLREITVHKPRNIVSIIVWGCILHNLTIINHEDIEVMMMVTQTDSQISSETIMMH
jgi:hypothetical protein